MKPEEKDRQRIDQLIDSARKRAAAAVNTEMVMLYWHIGERTRRDILGPERADYGKRIVQTLSEKLTSEYRCGFTRTNLFNMIRFAEMCRVEPWSTKEILDSCIHRIIIRASACKSSGC
ncbi:MAG TPA: DUF1016 N-terminal domain-containing protein [Candidatus Methanoperedens sp.]